MEFEPEYFKNYIDTVKLLKDTIFGVVESVKKEVDMESNKQPSLNFRYFLCDKSGAKFEFFILESDRDKKAEFIRKEIIDPENDCLDELDGLFCGYVTHVGNSDSKELEEL